MTNATTWVKNNKLAVALLIILVIFVGKESIPSQPIAPLSITKGGLAVGSRSIGMGVPAMDSISEIAPVYRQESAPTSGVDRLVLKDTSLSLKVNDVAQSISKMEESAVSLGGYLVDSTLTVPEGASTGSISVRVPSEKREEALTQFRSFGVKTVSEYVNGQDVTDQYVDNKERLRILETTKTKFEDILANAKSVNDMLNVQRELLSLQQQIDAIKGEQAYLEGSAKLTRITVYLSTDELALPYAPDESWRPSVVLKEAIRSLILNVRGILNAIIWIAVFFPFWGIGFGVIYLLVRALKKR